MKNNKISKVISEVDELFLKLYLVLGLFILAVIFVFKLYSQTESLEWSFYEASSIIIFILFLTASFILNKHKITKQLYINCLYGLLIFYGLFTIFLIFSGFLKKEALLLFLLFGIPIIQNLFKQKDKFKVSIDLRIEETKSGIYFLTSMLAVISYFYEEFIFNNITTALFVILTAIIFYLFYEFFEKKIINLFNLRHYLKMSVFTLFIICFGVFCFFWIKSPYDYHHCSFYIGPVFDVIKGKSLVYDTPSQYGYLSIHFLAFVFRFFKLTFENFNILDTILFVLAYVIESLILLKIFKKLIPTFLFTLILFAFQSTFSKYSNVLYPSTGPLRFGIGIIVCLILAYFPNKKGLVLGSIFSSFALFWSCETAIYVVPAWLFVCLIGFLTTNTINNKQIVLVLKRLIIPLSFYVLLFLIIFLCEYKEGYKFPFLTNYFQYSTTYKNGFGALPISGFGNYFSIIFIMIVGIAVLVHLFMKKIFTAFFPLLTFITIHNFAIFSYFISRSHSNNIINISSFYLIEAIVIYKILMDLYADKILSIKKYFNIILIVFATAYCFCCLNNIPSIKNRFIDSIKFDEYINKQDTSILNIKKEYNLKNKKVIVISDLDTQILLDLDIKNELPLNPRSMTILLSDSFSKYIIPNINNIKNGTILIFDETLDSKYEPFLKQEIYKKVNQVLVEFDKKFLLLKLDEFEYGEPKRPLQVIELQNK